MMGLENRFTIVKDGKTITLVLLYPKQVYDDQIKLKKECEDGKSENRERERERKRVVLSELHLLRPPLDCSHF